MKQWHAFLLLVSTLIPSITWAQATSTEIEQALLGHWYCTTDAVTDYGPIKVNASINIQTDAMFSSTGQLLLSNQALPNPMPMNFSATGSWALKGNQLTTQLTKAELASGNAFIDSLAQAMKKEILNYSQHQTTLTALSNVRMSLVDNYSNTVHCLR